MRKIDWLLCVLLIIKLVIESAICDCGIPAIPINTRIDSIKSRYSEAESVHYACDLDKLVLIVNDVRICRNSSWTRSLPTCVIGPKLVEWQIELESNITQTAHKLDDHYHQSSKHYCTQIKRNSKSAQSFFIRLKEKIARVLYFELYFDNRNTGHHNISKVEINDIRVCYSVNVAKQLPHQTVYGFRCDVSDEVRDESQLWKMDTTDTITVTISENSATLCDIKIYVDAQMVYMLGSSYWCGEIEKPLHTKVEVFSDVESEDIFGSSFRYTCTSGFKLIGNQVVRCGINYQWLDEFPVCVPDVANTCKLYNNAGNYGTRVHYEHMHQFDDTNFAINNSIAIFSCLYEEYVMIGDSVHLCDGNGKWIGSQPFCSNPIALNSQPIKYKTQKLLLENVTHFEIYRTDIENRCGIPALALHTHLMVPRGYSRFSTSYLKSDYSNGTRYSYTCLSHTRLVDFNHSIIQCIDGVWKGNQIICYIDHYSDNHLTKVDLYDYKPIENGYHLDYNYIVKSEDVRWKYYAYHRNPVNNECNPTMSMNGRHKWILHFNQSSVISRLHLSLSNLKRLNVSKVLKNQIIRVFIDDNECPLLDYSHHGFGLASNELEFNCENILKKTTDKIKLLFNFSEPQSSQTLSLCSVRLAYNELKCGSPAKPLNSLVDIDSNTANAIYSCKSGYELSGNAMVKCGLNGRWDGDVPRCVPKALCAKHNQIKVIENKLIVNYFNTYKKHDTDVAKHRTIAIFSCNSTQFILIGSRVRMCLLTGVWSGSLPACKLYAQNEGNHRLVGTSEHKRSGSVATIVLGVLFVTMICVTLVYIYQRRYQFADLRYVMRNYFHIGYRSQV